MNVVLSIGYGRLHLVQSAVWLAKAGCKVRLVCGWVPRNADGLVVRVCSRIVGRDLSHGLKKRLIQAEGVATLSMPLVEFLNQGVRTASRLLHIPSHLSAPLMWSLFGFCSRRYIKKGSIFHCRSGAGQGGAIRRAKKIGVKVLVDHSALHPAKSEQNLKDDYARWGQRVAISPKAGVWKNVVADCQDADMIMVNANHIRDSFIEQGYSPERLRVVYLGVRSDFFGLKISYALRDRMRILYTGTFSILKGAEYTLEAVRILVERGVNVQLDVYGLLDAPIALREKYRDCPVVYHGAVPQDDLKAALAESDVYLFPSLADGCAQSGMEALAAGLPVVATYQSGLPITDGETGCVVPMKDAVIIADKLEWLKAHEDERERIGRNAAKMIAGNYTWEKYAENVKKLYADLGRIS